MATILVTTTIDVNKAQKKQLFNEVNKAIIKTFPAPSILFRDIEREDCYGLADNQVQIFVCVPPYMEVERRKKLVKDLEVIKLNSEVCTKDSKIITTFHYHDDEDCGVDGVLRADAKKVADKSK